MKSLSSELNKLFPDCIARGFDDPKACLDYVNHQYNETSFIDGLVAMGEEYADHLSIQIDLRGISAYVENPNRFQEISCIIADYAMPSMNGVELCKQINNAVIRKIMLTGEADSELAVSAFNQGVIQQFLTKNTRNLTSVLHEIVKDQCKAYFLHFTSMILNEYDEQAKTLLDMLSDPLFASVFNTIVEDNQIVEYYLLNENGSYLLVDKKGNTKVLAIQSEKMMESYLDMINYAEQSVPEEITHKITQRSHLPYFHNEADLEAAPHEWQAYLLPCQVIEGAQQHYYYALITNAEQFAIDDYDIIASAQYKKSLTKS